MKELSLEEKATRYDEAIKRAIEWSETKNGYYMPKELCEEIFPELKESEDERIRKEIIYHIQNCDDTIDKETEERMVAWLEKQGRLMKALQITNGRVGELIEENYYLKENLEKQSKQKPNLIVLKFKVDDWVINTITKKVEQVIELTDCEYICSGHLIVSFNDQHLLRKWTIKDAKEGDILVCGKTKRPFIFKGLLDKEHPESPVAYCGIDYYDDFTTHTGISWWTDDEVQPATKEQCALLHQKMKEYGYEWDSEKKELKKIEDKHTCELDNSYAHVIFPFKAKVKSSDAIITIYDGQLSSDGKEWIKYQSDAEDGYKVYEPNNLELVCEIEQKPAWNEEDEERLQSCLKILQAKGLMGVTETINTKWLKSLKDRVQPKPNQEWSDWDKTIIESIEALCDEKIESVVYQDVKQHVNDIKDWLKSLKERYSWKPSDEQIELLEEIQQALLSKDYHNRFVNFIYELKRLREE